MIQNIIVHLCIAVIEIISIYEITKHLSNSKSNKIYFAIIIFIYLGYSILKVLFFNYMIINLICGFIFMMAFTFMKKIKIYKRILAVTIFMIMSVLLETVVALIISAITNILVAELSKDIIIYTLGSISSKFIIYFLARVLFKFILQKGTNAERKVNVWNLITPLATLIVIFALTFMSLYTSSTIVKWLAVASSMFLIIGNVSSLAIYEYGIKNKIKAELEKYERVVLIEEQKELNSVIQRQIIANKEIHEVKNKMFSLRELILSDKAQALAQADELCNIYKNKELVQYTMITDVDVLLNVKKHYAKERGLDIKYTINIQGVITIDSTDLCMIFGNLLNNAIENAEKSEINMQIITFANYLSIKCQNYTTKSLEPLRYTSKDNSGLMHGYGLAKIVQIAEKYNGKFDAVIKDGSYIAIANLQIDRGQNDN